MNLDDLADAADPSTYSELTVPSQLALLPAPAPETRAFLPVPAQDSARRVVTVYPAVSYL